MERFKRLSRFQKGILLFLLAMTLVFTVAYPVTISRVGFAYKGAILVPRQENGHTVYAGRLRGQQTRFTVSADGTVVLQHGDTTYDPYTAREDPSAVPKDSELAGRMTGVELRQGEAVLFRGGVLDAGGSLWLYNADGSFGSLGISHVTSDGIERDENGNEIDPIAPSASDLLALMAGPTLTHKGEWAAWFGAVFLCAVTALSVLFADELFRWNLAFWIRNADQAEPSDWEIAGRSVSWTVLSAVALALFILGLQ